VPDRYDLIGAEASYYTAKVRAALRAKRLPFHEVLATRKVFAEHPIFRDGIRSLPVLTTPDGEVVADSTDIIDLLERRHPEPALVPPSPWLRVVALLLEAYADEWLLIAAMHHRWSFPAENREYLLAETGRSLVPDASPAEQRRAGEKLERNFLTGLPLLGITDETKPAIDAWYLELLAQLDAHLVVHPFVLGPRLSLADVALMGPFYGHFSRDPYPSRLMLERAPRVAAWVARVHGTEGAEGAWPTADTTAPTLDPILRRVAVEHLPVLLDIAHRTEEWIDANPGKPIPRGIGMHEVRIGGVATPRSVTPYAVTMLQRVLDECHALPAAARDAVDAQLRRLGGCALGPVVLRHRLRRRDNVLEVVV
jgi:glutathione S-transferase